MKIEVIGMAITTKEQLLKVLRAFSDRYDQSCKRLIDKFSTRSRACLSCLSGRLFLCALCYNYDACSPVSKEERILFSVNVQV
jgi:hypothetical protein